jgi:hypothetical protein
MYSKNKQLRQVTIEGICKMLFSIKFAGKLEGKDQEDEGVISLISQLVI